MRLLIKPNGKWHEKRQKIAEAVIMEWWSEYCVVEKLRCGYSHEASAKMHLHDTVSKLGPGTARDSAAPDDFNFVWSTSNRLTPTTPFPSTSLFPVQHFSLSSLERCLGISLEMKYQVEVSCFCRSEVLFFQPYPSLYKTQAVCNPSLGQVK